MISTRSCLIVLALGVGTFFHAAHASAVVLALYDFENGGNGNFNTNAFDSVDTNSATSASRLSQGGGLHGGGASALILNISVFNTSNSRSPGLNAAGANTTSAALATAAGDFFQFTITPHVATNFQSLSFFTDAFTSGQVDVSRDGILLASITPPGGNVPVELRTINFADFASVIPVTFRFTLYGTPQNNHAIRFDDIQLIGAPVPEPGTVLLVLLGGAALLGYGRRTRSGCRVS